MPVRNSIFNKLISFTLLFHAVNRSPLATISIHNTHNKPSRSIFCPSSSHQKQRKKTSIARWFRIQWSYHQTFQFKANSPTVLPARLPVYQGPQRWMLDWRSNVLVGEEADEGKSYHEESSQTQTWNIEKIPRIASLVSDGRLVWGSLFAEQSVWLHQGRHGCNSFKAALSSCVSLSHMDCKVARDELPLPHIIFGAVREALRWSGSQREPVFLHENLCQ